MTPGPASGVPPAPADNPAPLKKPQTDERTPRDSGDKAGAVAPRPADLPVPATPPAVPPTPAGRAAASYAPSGGGRPPCDQPPKRAQAGPIRAGAADSAERGTDSRRWNRLPRRRNRLPRGGTGSAERGTGSPRRNRSGVESRRPGRRKLIWPRCQRLPQSHLPRRPPCRDATSQGGGRALSVSGRPDRLLAQHYQRRR